MGLSILLLNLAVAAPQTPAWRVQGEATKERFYRYTEHFDSSLKALRGAAKAAAPELLPKIDPAPPKEMPYGWGYLPEVLPGKKSGALNVKAIPASTYSWPQTNRFIEKEEAALEEIDEKLSVLKQLSANDQKQILAKVVDDLPLCRKNHALIDHHIKHNFFWQEQVAENRPHFDARQKAFSENPETASYTVSALPTSLTVQTQANVTRMKLSINTDIADTAFIKRFEGVVESTWQAQSPQGTRYLLDVVIKTLPLEKLYGPGSNRPKRGDHINTDDHVARFPKTAAVLTTGAAATYALPSRGVVLGPQALDANVLAHEFGHILGFADSYFRGYRDLGEQGFEIVEVEPNPTDIMASPDVGSVSYKHFQALIAAKRSQSN